LSYAHGTGITLLDGKPVANGDQLTLAPWDLAIVEESAAGASALSKEN